MKYMCLIYGNMANAPQYTPEEASKAQQYWFTLVGEMQAAGVYIENYGLAPVNKATTVRVRDNKTVTTNGPFAEAPEDLAGCFVLSCKTLDEAVEWAAKIPFSHNGSIEVRPIIEYT